MMTVAFIGNPNCGKTTLFNAYTGANLKVANWPGVTVEKVEGSFTFQGEKIRLVDLPGTYSLTSYTMEEQVSRNFILSDEVDVVIDVVDASALERNLYLTLQLLELGKPVVIALNMMDIVEKRGMEIDLHRLPEMLGAPVIPVSARKRRGLESLIHAAVHHKDGGHDPLIHDHKNTKPSRHRHDHHSEFAMVYSDAIEDKIDLGEERLRAAYPGLANYRLLALKTMENDRTIKSKYPIDMTGLDEDATIEDKIINEKYDFIEEIIEECLVGKAQKEQFTDRIDQVLTHRVWSIPVFLGIMALVFFLTFTVGDFLKGYVEGIIDEINLLAAGLLGAVHANENHYFPAKHFYTVFGAGNSGGQRLYVPGSLCDGRNYGASGTFGQGLYSHASWIWLYGSGDYGFQSPGRPERPPENHAGDAFYVLLRKTAGIHIVFRTVFSGKCHARLLLHVCNRNSGRYFRGLGSQYD